MNSFNLWFFLFVQPHSVEKREILSHWKKISSNRLFSNFFSKSIAFTKFLRKKCERISAISTLYTMSVEKYYKRLSLLLRQSNIFSVKSTFIQKKLVKSWFHEIFERHSLSIIILFHTVEAIVVLPFFHSCVFTYFLSYLPFVRKTLSKRHSL